MSQALNGRRGRVFPLRITDEERAALERAMRSGGGPRALGPFLLWAALEKRAGKGLKNAAGITRARAVLPSRAVHPVIPPPAPPKRTRVILDLCAGTGAWSEPYRRAGYRVVRVELPRFDVRTFVAPRARVWGILAAPPCNEFSMAKRGPRDFALGMACVNAVYRLVAQTRPRWWALENPVGKLSHFLGTPRDVFEPCDFGDPWTKRTALWGEFCIPERGPYVKPASGKLRIASGAEERARTPSGFARAFFRANP